ncbi:MAG: ABC transporter permease subunit [Planctomycetaceae bacterium]
MFDAAIWRKTWGDQRALVLALGALWMVFPWIYIWLSAQIPMSAFQDVLLRAIPQDWQRLSGVPLTEVGTHVGRVALMFVDPVVVLGATVFGITRGSDVVSGPLERGTLEMILAQPVRRAAVFVSHALATVAAAALLAAVLWGAAAGAVALGPWAGKVDPWRLAPAAANAFGLMVCFAGIAACVSAIDSHRWRTVGVMCGCYVFSILAKLVGRLSDTFAWCGWLSVFNVYEPQRLVGDPATSWRLLLAYDGALLGIGLAGFAIGAWLFSRRDLPAPL